MEPNRPTFQEIKKIYLENFLWEESISEQIKQQKSNSSQSKEISYAQQTIDTFNQINNKASFTSFQDFQYDSQDFEEDQNFQEDQECSKIDIENNEQQQQNTFGCDKSDQYIKMIDGRKKNKDRKIRTTITPERLEEMNKIFKEYMEDKDKGRNPNTNLKQIGIKLQLGYSTILHKFRQYRQNKVVKGGALLESLQKKRKYTKTKIIQHYIQLSLKERPFYTAVELSKYIFRRYKIKYSRSIISRHLTEMGYSFNNIKPFPIEKNALKYVQARKLFVKIMQTYSGEDPNLIYIDQAAFSKHLFTRYSSNLSISVEDKRLNQRQEDYVSLMVSASSEKLYHYQIKSGFFSRQDFCIMVSKTGEAIYKTKRYSSQSRRNILLTDIHRIHQEYPSIEEGKPKKVTETIHKGGMHRFFLPPGSPQLNPLESLFLTIRQKLAKQNILDQDYLRSKLQSMMKNISKESTKVYFKELNVWLHKAKYGQNF